MNDSESDKTLRESQRSLKIYDDAEKDSQSLVSSRRSNSLPSIVTCPNFKPINLKSMASLNITQSSFNSM